LSLRFKAAMTFEPNSKALALLTLVTGPTRSGKSDWAEALAANSPFPVRYFATALETPDDLEWQARIAAHRNRRPEAWTTTEVPFALAEAIETALEPCCILIDALGTWVANGLEQSREDWQTTETAFLKAIQNSTNPIILVAEEVGWGVVPAYPTGRLFRDRLGNLTRSLGKLADRVYLVTVGYAVDLKAIGYAVPGM
jgi:adenosylcobinamide kinase / adenosylcobinamide-phosphate guanylyltransferase